MGQETPKEMLADREWTAFQNSVLNLMQHHGVEPSKLCQVVLDFSGDKELMVLSTLQLRQMVNNAAAQAMGGVRGQRGKHTKKVLKRIEKLKKDVGQ